MGYYKNGKKNGSLKKEININESVKNIRKKLMEKRLKERSS